MARTVKSNPQIISGTIDEQKKVRAKDALTWKASELGYYDANGQAAVLATAGTKVNFQFAQDQTSNTSSSDVWVQPLNSTNILEGYVSSADADATTNVANVGQDYAIYVGSNYHTVDTGDTTNVAVTVEDYGGRVDPLHETAGSTSPGRVWFRFKASVLDAS